MHTESTPRNFRERTGRPLMREVAETESRTSGIRSAALIVNTRSRLGRTMTKALGYLRLLGVISSTSPSATAATTVGGW